MADDILDIAGRLRELRKKEGLTLREVCEKAKIAPSYLSSLERGSNSPTLATLRKILKALNSNLEKFFVPPNVEPAEGHVFRRENMSMALDGTRRYTFVLPRREDIKIEVLDEYHVSSRIKPEFEVLDCDVSGIILTGILELEIEGEKKEVLRAGDAFYISAGKKNRGRCIGSEPIHLITIFIPPKY